MPGHRIKLIKLHATDLAPFLQTLGQPTGLKITGN